MKTTEKNLETVVNEINNVYSKKGLILLRKEV